MSKKGTKLSDESKASIGEANRRRSERRHAQLELVIERNRLFIRALGNNAVSVQIDVTPLWHFFKEAMAYSRSKSSL